jgi:hypothetical protein
MSGATLPKQVCHTLGVSASDQVRTLPLTDAPDLYNPALAQVRATLDENFSVGTTYEFFEQCKRGGWHALAWQDLLFVAQGLLVIAATWISVIFFSRSISLASWAFTWTVIGMALVLVSYHCVSIARLRSFLARELEHSGLAVRLIDGLNLVEEFHVAVPFPYSQLFARPAPNLKGAVRCVCNNTAWFLQRPRRYVNPKWMLALLGYALLPVAFGLSIAAIGIELTHLRGGGVSQSLPPLLEFWASSSLLLPLIFLAQLMFYLAATEAYSSRLLCAYYLKRELGLR